MELIIAVSFLLIGQIIGFFIGKKLNQAKLQKDITTIKNEKHNLESKVQYISDLNNENKKLISNQRSEIIKLEKKVSTLEEINKNLNEKLTTLNEDFQKNKESMKSEFESLAFDILEKNSERFKKSSSEKMTDILNPFKEQVKSLKEEIEKKFKQENDERIVLKTELRSLIELNQTITEETNNLTKALRSDSKKQGNWGEFKLELILESSGLEKGKEYLTQGGGMQLKSDCGNAELPDVIILLPEKKHLIIDSKVSLVAYTNYITYKDIDKKENAKGQILSSIKNHVDNLSTKKYHLNEKLTSPEFTFLFIPMEGPMSLVIDLEVPRIGKSLMQYAWDKSIVIVTPTTLMSTLRTICSIWKFDKQERNALKIAEQGGKIYDKFVGFVENLQEIDLNLTKTQNSYQEAFKKLSSGKGNLIYQVEKIKELGAKTKKNIPNDLTSQV